MERKKLTERYQNVNEATGILKPKKLESLRE